MKFNDVNSIEQRIFYYLAGMALAITLSREVANVFLELALLAMVHRLWLKHDDIVARYRECRTLWRLLALALVAPLLSSLFSVDPLDSLKSWLRLPVFYATGMAAVLLFVRERRRIYILLGLIGVSLALNSCIELGQFALQPVIGARHSGRLHYMVWATLLTVWLGVLLCLRESMQGRYRILWYSSLGLSVVALVLNGTRGAYLAAVVLAIAMLLLTAKTMVVRLRRLAMLAAILALALSLLGGFASRAMSATDIHAQSQNERLLIWQSAWNMFCDNPVLGVGYDEFGPVYLTEYISPAAKERLGHAHNNILNTLAEQGIVGTATLVGAVLYLTYLSYSRYRRTGRTESLLLLAVVWGTMLHGMTEYTFWSSYTVKYLYLMVALSYRLDFCDSEQ